MNTHVNRKWENGQGRDTRGPATMRIIRIHSSLPRSPHPSRSPRKRWEPRWNSCVFRLYTEIGGIYYGGRNCRFNDFGIDQRKLVDTALAVSDIRKPTIRQRFYPLGKWILGFDPKLSNHYQIINLSKIIQIFKSNPLKRRFFFSSTIFDRTFEKFKQLLCFFFFFYRKKKVGAVRGILMQMHEHLGFSLRLNHAGNGR